MEAPEYSVDFSSSPYLQRLHTAGFDEYYIAPSSCLLEGISLAITFSSASNPAYERENWANWVAQLRNWVTRIRTSQADPLLWRGLKSEVLLEMFRWGIQEETDETRIFAALIEKHPFSIVWFEEVSSLEIQPKYYPYRYQGYWSFFLYLGKDLRGNIYAFHHAEQSNLSSRISCAIAGPDPPVVLPTISPNEQFTFIASLIVQSCQQLPPGLLSDGLQESIQEYSRRWLRLGANLPSDLPNPLDIASIGSVLDILTTRFLSAHTLARIPEHEITECARYPSPSLISHGQTPKLHYFHFQCLRKYAQIRLMKQPSWKTICPLCGGSLTQEILDKLTQELGPDERTSSLRQNY